MTNTTDLVKQLNNILKDILTSEIVSSDKLIEAEKLYASIKDELDDESRYILQVALDTSTLLMKESSQREPDLYYEELFKQFGSSIKEYRLKREMTTSVLSQLSGLSISYLSNLEKGICSNLSFKTIDVLAKTLKIPQKEMLDILKWTELP